MVAKIALALVTLLPSLALAAPVIPAPPAEGSYAFAGNFRVTIKLQYRVVYAFTDAGSKELDSRRKAGEECWNKGREIYLCKSFGATDGAPALLATRVAKELAGKTLVLEALRGEPTLVSHGTDVAEYQVPQRARFDGKTYEAYRLVNTQGFWSIRLGEQTETQLNLTADGGLEMPLDVPVTLSREAYDVYGVAAAYAR